MTETVAINPAMSITGVELMNQWYCNPAYFAIMSDCANTQEGVWSENSTDRTVVVAVYGQPEPPTPTAPVGPQPGVPSPVVMPENVPLDPSPDYDATDEIEYGINWLPWNVRGAYPRPLCRRNSVAAGRSRERARSWCEFLGPFEGGAPDQSA